MRLIFIQREQWALSWIAEEPAYMQRTSHALVDDGRYWLVDAVDGDGLSEQLAALGEAAGVLQLYAHHPRDGEALAARLDAPFHALPSSGVPDSPFEVVSLGGGRLWREVAIWWAVHRALVVPESLGTVAYFRAGAASACGVHPFRRLAPPRVLARYAPAALLPGHGPPLWGERVTDDVREALALARRGAPRWLAALPSARRRGQAELDEIRSEANR